MQYDLKQMDKVYGKKTIEECVTLAKTMNEELISRGEELVRLLWYLEKSKRYHDWPGYQSASFKEFVWEICHIPYNRFREMAYAYNWFPKEAREYGPVVIESIRNKVGVARIPKVLNEIKATLKTTDPAKKREVVNQIIDKHAPLPKHKSGITTDTKAYWRQKYEDLFIKYKALEKENEELKGRLAKMKPSVEAYLAIKDAVGPIVEGQVQAQAQAQMQ